MDRNGVGDLLIFILLDIEVWRRHPRGLTHDGHAGLEVQLLASSERQERIEPNVAIAATFTARMGMLLAGLTGLGFNVLLTPAAADRPV